MKKVCDSNSSGHISNTGASRTNKLLMAGLFSALTGVCSWININLFFTPVPVNMALMGPYLAGLMLGCRYGFFSQIIYILFRCFRYTCVCRLHIRSRGNSRAHRRFYRRLYHVRSHMRPASQKKRFLLSYHADDMRSYRLLRFGAGVVYDPHSLDSVGRSCGLRHSVSAGRRCKDSSCGRIVKISRQSLPFSVKAA